MATDQAKQPDQQLAEVVRVAATDPVLSRDDTIFRHLTAIRKRVRELLGMDDAGRDVIKR